MLVGRKTKRYMVFGISIICILLLIMSGSSCKKLMTIEVGMTYDEFENKNTNIDYKHYFGYVFHDNGDGTITIASFEPKSGYTVGRIETYSKPSPSKNDFGLIKPGMDLFEVTKLVGIPKDSTTFGFATLDYLSEDGLKYIVYLQTDIEGDMTMKVSNIVSVGENSK